MSEPEPVKDASAQVSVLNVALEEPPPEPPDPLPWSFTVEVLMAD